jgi:glycosyltransferase involved in cell wall biosynthesis
MPGMRDDVPDCLRALDVLALPSFVEGISNTVLEALACGVPVVATAVGGNPELVDAGRTGELVTSGDAEALADRIEDYFERPARLREHAAAAREAAVGRFGLDGMVDAYEAVYRNGLRHAGRLRCDPPDPASTEPAAPAPKRGAATRDKRSLTCAD